MAVNEADLAVATPESAEPAVQATPTPEAVVPEASTETPEVASAEAASAEAATETPKPAVPDLATRLSALEQQHQQTIQERDYYRGSYETQAKQQAEQAEQAADAQFQQELINEYRPRLTGLDKDSPEYKSIMREAWLEQQAYNLEKREKAAETKERDILYRSAELGRDAFYQQASVTHKVPLATLKRLLPRTDNINVVDAVARAWKEATDETTRRLSANNRIVNNTDIMPSSSSGTGGLGIQWMEDAEAANSAGKLTWPQFEALRAKLTYKDGTRPSY